MKKFLLLIGCAIAISSLAQKTTTLGEDSPLRKLAIAQMAISNLYVDTVDNKKLTEDAIRGMLEKLDPHSSYFTPKEVKSFNEPLQGGFEGVGVQFNVLEDTLLVVQTINDGPSEKAGIIAGDRFVSVNDTAIAGVKMSKEEIMRRLRGPKGTKVKIGVKRAGIKDILSFVVVRDKIPLNTVEASYMIRPGVGYIRLSSFGATTPTEVTDAIKKMQSVGMQNLILDLQDNGGGYLSTVLYMASEFLDSSNVVLQTRSDEKAEAKKYYAVNNNKKDYRVVVLVNGNSASASEIMTAALKEQYGATIVGTKTYGKGTVQLTKELSNGGMIKYTTEEWLTAKGNSINDVGIEPDVEVELGEEYLNDPLDKKNDAQLQKAIEVLK